MVFCHHCSQTVDVGETVGRRDSCPKCGWDLHICYDCLHYDPKAYNECREPQADRVLDKDKSNFCDFFSPRADKIGGGPSQADEAKAKLEALFKKPK